MKKGLLDINNGKIYYEIYGQGEPIVFIHGFTFDNRVWDKQIDFLSSKYKVIRYDLRGFGKSSLPDSSGYSHVEDLKSLLDLLRIDKANLIGNSYGGNVVINFTFKYPERVYRMILAESGMKEVQDTLPMPDRFFKYFTETYKIAQDQGIDSAKSYWLNGLLFKTVLSNKESELIARQMIKDYSGWHWINKDTEIKYQAYKPERLKTILIPTLIIVGKLSDTWIKDIATLQYSSINGSKFVEIDNAGHNMSIENAIQFNKEIDNFISDK